MTSETTRTIDMTAMVAKFFAENAPPRPPSRAIAVPALVLLLLLSAFMTWLSAEFLFSLNRAVLRSFCPFSIAFAAGIPFFCLFRFVRLYIFEHEITHYLTAKLFFRETGSFSFSQKKGAVEIRHPNAAIILAPYIIPLYFLVIAGLYEFALAVLPSAPPQWVALLIRILLGASLAHHLVMTAVALRRAQLDFQFLGSALSLALIYAGNSLLLYISLLFATEKWQQGLELPLYILNAETMF